MMDEKHLPALRLAGAALLLAGGAIHTWLAFERYGTADLETVFLLNGAGSALIAAAVVVGRWPLAAVAGAAISAVSLAAFGLSRMGDGLVGFRATGLEPAPEALLTLLVEGAALVVLVAVAVIERSRLAATLKEAWPGGA